MQESSFKNYGQTKEEKQRRRYNISIPLPRHVILFYFFFLLPALAFIEGLYEFFFKDGDLFLWF
jgi:hypothetical protein